MTREPSSGYCSRGPNLVADKLKMLFVDDDRDLVEQHSTDLKSSLEEKGVSSEILSAESFDQAIQTLLGDSFDLAIIDLRLKGGKNGNDILKSVIESHIMPIIIYSGYQDDLDLQYKDHGFIFVAEKKKVGIIVEKILDWKKKKVFYFFSKRGFLASSLQKVLQDTMWHGLSKYWDSLDTDDMEMLNAIAGRIAASLVHDRLAHPSEGGQDETLVHHCEVYVLGSAKKYLAMGDVVRSGKKC